MDFHSTLGVLLYLLAGIGLARIAYQAHLRQTVKRFELPPRWQWGLVVALWPLAFVLLIVMSIAAAKRALDNSA